MPAADGLVGVARDGALTVYRTSIQSHSRPQSVLKSDAGTRTSLESAASPRLRATGPIAPPRPPLPGWRSAPENRNSIPWVPGARATVPKPTYCPELFSSVSHLPYALTVDPQRHRRADGTAKPHLVVARAADAHLRFDRAGALGQDRVLPHPPRGRVVRVTELHHQGALAGCGHHRVRAAREGPYVCARGLLDRVEPRPERQALRRHRRGLPPLPRLVELAAPDQAIRRRGTALGGRAPQDQRPVHAERLRIERVRVRGQPLGDHRRRSRVGISRRRSSDTASGSASRRKCRAP